MKKSGFTDSQIVVILKVAVAGMKVADVCRKHGSSQPTYYNWKSKYGGMSASELESIKELEAEHSKLKRMYADLAMENDALKELIGKKLLRPAEKREAVEWLKESLKLPVTRACKAVGLRRSSWHRPEPDRGDLDAPVIAKLNEVVSKHGRGGFWKCFPWMRPRRLVRVRWWRTSKRATVKAQARKFEPGR